MVGGGFQHDICSSSGSVPKHVEWDKQGTANISIHIDHAIMQPVDKTKRNFAWVAESSAVIIPVIEWLKANIEYIEQTYELLFTHDARIASLSPKFKMVLANAVPWVKNRGMYDKTKLVSMIASSKNFCQGHNFRQTILAKYKGKIDCFGSGWNYIEKKEQGLNDYCFSIAMENDNYDNIFTEKITDCFVTGTIPIFWGSPTIGNYFNIDGIIPFTPDLKIEDLTLDLYESKVLSIEENFNIAIDIPIAEDYIYLKYIAE